MVTRDEYVEIRAGRAGDVPSLVPLYEEWGHPQTPEVIAERLSTWEATPHAEVLVAEVDGNVAGVAAVCACPHLARPGSYARLTGIVVGASCRRRGIGRALMRAAEDCARIWGCDRIELTTTRSRAEAPAFYPSLGYEDASQRQARFVRGL
jgi:GNAT superfamily N-acetyltransferase